MEVVNWSALLIGIFIAAILIFALIKGMPTVSEHKEYMDELWDSREDAICAILDKTDDLFYIVGVSLHQIEVGTSKLAQNVEEDNYINIKNRV